MNVRMSKYWHLSIKRIYVPSMYRMLILQLFLLGQYFSLLAFMFIISSLICKLLHSMMYLQYFTDID